MLRGRHAIAVAPLVAVALALAACGSGGDGDDSESGSPAAKVPSTTQFPKTRGRTMNELTSSVQPGPVLAPSVGELTPGTNRFGFGLFDRARRQITQAPAAIYVGRGPNARAYGPYVARWEDMKVKSRYLSKSVQTDPDAAKTVYVSNVDFKKPGKYVVVVLVRLDNRLVGAAADVKVLKKSNVPKVGDKPPLIHTPTKQSVGGDLSKIDTREPHDDMHDVDFASVYGKKPIVYIVSTPALCQSRVCGPVLDIAEQVKHEHKNDAAWIHMEVYNDNDVNKGFRPQLVKWNLQTEPWVFTIDRKGRVAARIEGAYGVDELVKAVDAATKR
jgi:hypothetical protein